MKRLVVLGSLNIDLVTPVERLPRAGETLVGGDLAMFEGGKGANEACAIGRLGGAVTMIGQVGADAFGTSLRDSLRAAGVDTSGIGVCTRSTGLGLRLRIARRRKRHPHLAGRERDPFPRLPSKGCVWLLPTIFCCARFRRTPMTTIVEAFRRGQAGGRDRPILDPAPVQPLPAELIPNLDFVTPNQIEAAALLGDTNSCIRSFDDARAAAASLLSAGYRGVVLKLGELGCYVATAQAGGAVPGFRVVAVDTTAAARHFRRGVRGFARRRRRDHGCRAVRQCRGGVVVTRPRRAKLHPARAEVESLFSRKERLRMFTVNSLGLSVLFCMITMLGWDPRPNPEACGESYVAD